MDKYTLRAIVVAAIAGVGLNFLLNLFSLAIGLNTTAYKVGQTIGFSYSGFLGFLVVSIIAMFTTGWIAGYLAPYRSQQKLMGALIGFIAWSLLLIVTTLIITNMIQFASFHTTFTSHPNMVAVRITNDAPMIAETKDQQIKVKSAALADTTKKEITLNAFVTFLLFLSGAIFSCLGGLVGYNQSKRNHVLNGDNLIG